mgnify:CR=1 FL=1
MCRWLQISPAKLFFLVLRCLPFKKTVSFCCWVVRRKSAKDEDKGRKMQTKKIQNDAKRLRAHAQMHRHTSEVMYYVCRANSLLQSSMRVRVGFFFFFFFFFFFLFPFVPFFLGGRKGLALNKSKAREHIDENMGGI